MRTTTQSSSAGKTQPVRHRVAGVRAKKPRLDANELGWRGNERRLDLRARRGKGLSSADETALSRRIASSTCGVTYDACTRTVRLTPKIGLRPNTHYTIWHSGAVALGADPRAADRGFAPFALEFRTGEGDEEHGQDITFGSLPAIHVIGLDRPRVLRAWPINGATRVPVHAEIVLEVDTDLDPDTVNEKTMGLRDVEAFRVFVEANMGLVHRAAGHYSRRGLPFDDLVQAGTLGLMRAVERFDPDRGNRFSTFSVWWIQQAIQRAASHLTPGIRIPDHAGEKLDRAARAEEGLAQRLRRHPSGEDLALEIGESPDFLTRLRRATRPPMSLDSPTNDATGTRLAELVPDPSAADPETAAAQSLERQVLTCALSSLAPQQSQVITLRYGFDDGVERTLSEVGGIMGLSRERVRQIEAKALGLLRTDKRVTETA